MAYSSILMRLRALVPKWLLFALAACFFAYYTGVSHGRAPYKTQQKVFDAVQVATAQHTKRDISSTYQKGKAVNESIKNVVCVIDGELANSMRVNSYDAD